MSKLLFIILLMPVALFAQNTAQKPDVWKPLQFFVGKWEGTGAGKSGNASVEREYKFVLGGKFLQVDHKSAYPPQEKNAKGEVHEDVGMISYDKARKQFIFRQFHIESFVIEYVLTVSEDGKTITFISESIENIPAGYKSKETYKILNENEFTETFEIAAPGKDFEVYSENKFKRKK